MEEQGGEDPLPRSCKENLKHYPAIFNYWEQADPDCIPKGIATPSSK